MKSVIHIFGASGSGTTTLAKKISEELGHRMMDTDDYYWMQKCIEIFGQIETIVKAELSEWNR